MVTRMSGITRFGMRSIVFGFVLCVFAVLNSSAQELQEQEQPSQNDLRPREETTSPQQNPVTIGGGMWGNQQNPSQEANPQSNASNSEDVNTNAETSGGGTADPGRGGIRRTTTTVGGVTREAAGTNPAGNPDEVPFDENMNLVFLLLGMLFAYVVIKRRTRYKAITTGK